MSKDSSRFSRLGVLAPAALSACMDASVLAVPAAGAIVSTVLKELSKAFMLKKWFHGIMSAKEAEALIMEKGKNGSFLVRESLAHPGEYVLSVRVRGRVTHVMIRKQHNKYDVGSGEQFDDLVGLIEHFRSYPMIETSGDVLRLLQPVSGTRLRAQDLDRKVQEMQVVPDDRDVGRRAAAAAARERYPAARTGPRQKGPGDAGMFDDLVGLIEHFRSHPMIETSGNVLRLLQPVSGTRLRAQDLDRKVQEMQEVDDTQKLENKTGFDSEFLTLKMLEERHVFTTNEGLRPENVHKNRYRNILPYDQTRVVLRQRDKEDSDYINANYIRPSRLFDSRSSVQSSNESLNSVHSLILRSESKKPVPLVTKSLSDDALREVKMGIRMDKINGNLVSDIVRDKTYIAAQGCLPNTKDDFWRMIWQEDVRIVVMITNEMEKGKKKCERYWPGLSQEEKFGGLLVRTVSETLYEDYLLRELDVTDQGCCRTIYQYQFTAWPDHGTPSQPDGVLHFIYDINRRMSLIKLDKNPPEQNMMCVHCSAGVGRTGTFIVLDMLIDKIKASGYNCDLDVHSAVKAARAQRSGMVQNKEQYRFIYLALQEYIDSNNLKLRKKVYTSDA